MGRPDVSKKVWHFHVSLLIWHCFVIPIYGCQVKITPDINPMYGGSCPRDYKNVSFVDVGLV